MPRESVSHEIDHVRTFESGARIALEIEWNNKDPFYDRDLENFKRLHADGAISAGRPELTKRPFFTHKRTYQERYAALGKASACVRSGLNPSIFSDGMCSTPQT